MPKNKLKTLKDFNKGFREDYGSVGCLYEHFEEDIKKEAIKYYKEYYNEAKKQSRQLGKGSTNVAILAAAMTFITDFFNLTEEDIK